MVNPYLNRRTMYDPQTSPFGALEQMYPSPNREGTLYEGVGAPRGIQSPTAQGPSGAQLMESRYIPQPLSMREGGGLSYFGSTVPQQTPMARPAPPQAAGAPSDLELLQSRMAAINAPDQSGGARKFWDFLADASEAMMAAGQRGDPTFAALGQAGAAGAKSASKRAASDMQTKAAKMALLRGELEAIKLQRETDAIGSARPGTAEEYTKFNVDPKVASLHFDDNGKAVIKNKPKPEMGLDSFINKEGKQVDAVKGSGLWNDMIRSNEWQLGTAATPGETTVPVSKDDLNKIPGYAELTDEQKKGLIVYKTTGPDGKASYSHDQLTQARDPSEISLFNRLTGETATVQRDSDEYAQMVTKGSGWTKFTPTGDVGGLGETLQDKIESELDSAHLGRKLIMDGKATMAKFGTAYGTVGGFKRFWQSLKGTAADVSKEVPFVADVQQQIARDINLGSISGGTRGTDPEVASWFNEELSSTGMIKNSLIYSYALAMKGSGGNRLNRQDIENAGKALNLEGMFNSEGDVLSSFNKALEIFDQKIADLERRGGDIRKNQDQPAPKKWGIVDGVLAPLN